MAKRRRKVVIAILAIAIISGGIYYLVAIKKTNSFYARKYGKGGAVAVRKFPFPYRAALSISNDIDKTSTAEEFLEIQDFLNTKNSTRMGEGVGLEIANSFFMFMPEEQGFSYFSTRPIDKIIIKKFIESGYIDSIHSWGSGYSGRQDALRAIRELNDQQLHISVWINHATAKSNLGRWFSKSALGDNKDSKFYHSDVTVPYGIKFVWLGSSTWVIGQATPIKAATFLGSFDSRYFLKSILNLAKESSKHLMSVFGLNRYKYALHGTNDLVAPVILDDGRTVYQFMRYDNHYNGIGAGATSKTMAYNLTNRIFRQLVKVNGYAILYTHMGKNSDCPQVIDSATQKSLRLLAEEYSAGRIYVTTLAKLLEYYLNQKYLNWGYSVSGDETRIEIKSVNDPIFGASVPTAEDLQGLTFYFPAGKKPRIFIGTQEVANAVINPPDETGRCSISIALTRLKYPDLKEERARLNQISHEQSIKVP